MVLKEADSDWRRSHRAFEEKHVLLTQRLDASNELEVEFEALTKANQCLSETVSEYRQKTKALLSENSSLRKRVDALESQSVTDRASKLQLMRQQRQTTNTEAAVKLLLDENQTLQFQLSRVTVDMDALKRDQKTQHMPSETGHAHKTPGLRVTMSCGTVTPGVKEYYTPSSAHSPLYVRAQSVLSPLYNCYSSNVEGWGSDCTETPEKPHANQSTSVYGFAAKSMKAAAKR